MGNCFPTSATKRDNYLQHFMQFKKHSIAIISGEEEAIQHILSLGHPGFKMWFLQRRQDLILASKKINELILPSQSEVWRPGNEVLTLLLLIFYHKLRLYLFVS